MSEPISDTEVWNLLLDQFGIIVAPSLFAMYKIYVRRDKLSISEAYLKVLQTRDDIFKKDE